MSQLFQLHYRIATSFQKDATHNFCNYDKYVDPAVVVAGFARHCDYNQARCSLEHGR